MAEVMTAEQYRQIAQKRRDVAEEKFKIAVEAELTNFNKKLHADGNLWTWRVEWETFSYDTPTKETVEAVVSVLTDLGYVAETVEHKYDDFGDVRKTYSFRVRNPELPVKRTSVPSDIANENS